ncbi:DUF4426 domain-containing protein [Aidingimonas lacisalsi]|uniref:DUF4426 domain-containing protein n=1 Tax=Aidingimonas lacisalsi TaxID=2604086 RepID=UPI0011D299E3|nr:DUF4426 domain-containing protein [Aidingimonas lacisalsi]
MRCHSHLHALIPCLGASLLLAATSLYAQQSKRVGDYQIHYSAVNTSFLSPDIASMHDIQRSKVLAMLNVSFLRDAGKGESEHVDAMVDGRIGGPSGQSEELAFRHVRDGEAHYQIATFRIREDAPMHFELDVTYSPDEPPETVSFAQRFYIDRE